MAKTNTTPKEKLNGTVRLLKQSLQLMLGMVVVGMGVTAWLSYPIGVIIVGVGLFAIGGTIVGFRRLIWDSYKKDFKSGGYSGLQKILFSPSMWSYRLNVYILWPLIMAAGVCLVVLGVFSRL